MKIQGENFHPDIVAQRDDHIFVIDVAIPYETSMEKLKSIKLAKETKYGCLKPHYLERAASVDVVGFVVGSRGFGLRGTTKFSGS